MKTRMTLKYTSYGDVEKTTIYKILTYFTKTRKDTLFRLDPSYKKGDFSWCETDIFIPSLTISNLEFYDTKEKYSHPYYVSFMCEPNEQVALLKLLFTICQLGDPGHSYSIIFGNDQKSFWDGDGSDRINEINFIENWNKKDFYEYDDHLPEKVLNFNRAAEEISNQWLKSNTNNTPLSNEDIRLSLTREIAKKMSELQYQKFLEIKNGNEN